MDDISYKEMGERIMLTRIMRGYTREGLADLAHISPKFLYEIETGRKGLSARNLYTLSRALKVDSEYLLTGKQAVEHDQKLMDILQLFGENYTEKLAQILLSIYEMM